MVREVDVEEHGMSAARVQDKGDQDGRPDQSQKLGSTPRNRNTRMTVNISPSTEAALKLMMEHEDVTLTEAVRRLIGYGELVYRAITLDGKDVLLRRDNETQQILLV